MTSFESVLVDYSNQIPNLQKPGVWLAKAHTTACPLTPWSERERSGVSHRDLHRYFGLETKPHVSLHTISNRKHSTTERLTCEVNSQSLEVNPCRAYGCSPKRGILHRLSEALSKAVRIV
jgi:hypothetical protein